MGTDSADDLKDAQQASVGIVAPADDEGPLGVAAFMLSVPMTAVQGEASEPDPATEALRSLIAEQRASGTWEPWFVDLPDSQDQLARSVGLPAALRAVAARNLERLYPPNVCRR